jgi:flagellar protein FliJ
VKSRDSVLRLKQFKVEELKRRLTTLDEIKADLGTKLADLDSFVSREGNRAGDGELGRLALPTLLRSIEQRRSNIRTTREELERERATHERDLAAACEDLQNFELAEEQRQRRSAEAQTRSAQFRRDELSMMRHLRKHATR